MVERWKKNGKVAKSVISWIFMRFLDLLLDKYKDIAIFGAKWHFWPSTSYTYSIKSLSFQLNQFVPCFYNIPFHSLIYKLRFYPYCEFIVLPFKTIKFLFFTFRKSYGCYREWPNLYKFLSLIFYLYSFTYFILLKLLSCFNLFPFEFINC